MENASTPSKFFSKIYGREGVADELQANCFFELTLIETYYLSKNLLYPEHFQPSWPEGSLPFLPVTWRPLSPTSEVFLPTAAYARYADQIDNFLECLRRFCFGKVM
jgi:hypothetical protein